MSRSIAEQRAARRLRKKRPASVITSSSSHNDDGEKDCHCHDENDDDGDNKSSGYTNTSSKPTQEFIQNSSSSSSSTCSGSGDYITAFTSITEKYPHHFNSGRGNRKSQYDDDRMSPIFNLQFNHKRQQLSKRELAIKLVQNQWRNGRNRNSQSTSPSMPMQRGGGRNCRQRTNSSGHYHHHTTTTMEDSHESNNDTDEECIQQQSQQQQPTSTSLVYRKPNIDYTSNSSEYQRIKYISDHTVVAVDSRGYLDFVGLPLHNTNTNTSCSTTLNNVQSNNNEEDSRRFGVGTHLARVPIAPPPSLTSSGIYHLGKHVLELYPYAQGEKVAIGLPSGQVRLFASERLDVLDSSSCTHGVTDTRRTTMGGEFTNPHAIWSCLPSTIASLGPKRRYTRSSQYGLYPSMIASMLTIPKREDLPESFHNLEYSMEITNWNTDLFLFYRQQNCPPFIQNHHYDALWAFREGGIGSNSALIGAFVDPELDCFSLRQFDERVANGGTTSSAVFVDNSCKEKCNGDDEVNSICFTGEFGLVTNHITNCRKKEEQILKFWDQRMLLGHQPVSKVNLVFPVDNVHGVLPSAECILNYDQGGNNSRSRQSSGVSLLPLEMGSDASSSSQNNLNSKSNIKVSSLVGSNDGNDLFAVSLVNSNTCRDEGVIIVDSSRREIVKEGGANHSSVLKSSCLSSNLDFVACHETRAYEIGDAAGAADYVSVFDISRYKSNNAHDSTHDSYSNKIGERKRKELDDTGCSHDRCIATIRPEFTDVYGIESTISCMAMSEFGTSIACGTSDGDIFILGSN